MFCLWSERRLKERGTLPPSVYQPLLPPFLASLSFSPCAEKNAGSRQSRKSPFVSWSMFPLLPLAYFNIWTSQNSFGGKSVESTAKRDFGTCFQRHGTVAHLCVQPLYRSASLIERSTIRLFCDLRSRDHVSRFNLCYGLSFAKRDPFFGWESRWRGFEIGSNRGDGITVVEKIDMNLVKVFHFLDNRQRNKHDVEEVRTR